MFCDHDRHQNRPGVFVSTTVVWCLNLAILVGLFALMMSVRRLLLSMEWVRDLLLQHFNSGVITMTEFANLQQAVDTLTATVAKDADIESSAIQVLTSIPDLIKSAVNDALQKGAPPSTLSAFGTLNDVLAQKGAALAAAIATVPGQAPSTVTVTVPAIPAGGIARVDYEAALTEKGLVVGTVTDVDGAPTATPPGDVVSTNPPADTPVALGSSVDIQVAQTIA